MLGIPNVGGLLFGYDLESVVDPFSKSLKEATGAGYDRSCLEGCFVNLHGKVKDGEGVAVLFQMVFEKFPFGFFDLFLVSDCPGIDCAGNLGLFNCCIILSERLVGGSVVEMIAESQLDVFLTFDDGWTQVLVTLNDKEVALVA